MVLLFCLNIGFEVTKSSNVQTLETYWQKWSKLMIGLNFYRTNSHFGFRVSTQSMIPKHFHFLNQSEFTVYQSNNVSNSMMKPYINSMLKPCSNQIERVVSREDEQFCDYDQKPTEIKCSLCKCSTPRSQCNESLYETAESLDSESNISVILPTSDQSTGVNGHDSDSNSTPTDHYAKRLIVRIFASSK